MIRKNLLKATLITTIIATILTTTACGKKTSGSNTADNTATKPQATVSAETKSNAAKELTKTSLVTFDYTDEVGNTYTLEGKAVANESGDAVIEVTDASGNKVTFTGKAKTVDGKLSVSDIAVKDAGTLVKADGSEIKVTTGSTVADASESNEGESNSDIAASDDVREEVETAKKEESVIEAAREEVTKAEESVKADDENNNDENNDTIIADNGNNGGNENTGNNNTGDSENTGDNGGNTDDNNTSDSNNTPTPSEPEEAPTTPADPEPSPAPVNPTPAPEEEKPTEPDNSKDDSDNGNNGGYDFPTVEGPNGPMYGADYEDRKMRGQDVNQGADKSCPYELKTVTTRYFFDSTSYSNRQGYYYVAINEYGDECESGFDTLAYNMGHYNNTRKKVGMYSCGMVWFCAFDD